MSEATVVSDGAVVVTGAERRANETAGALAAYRAAVIKADVARMSNDAADAQLAALRAANTQLVEVLRCAALQLMFDEKPQIHKVAMTLESAAVYTV